MLSFVADCSRCAGLCCIALPYQASADFPVSKPADRPCRHLDAAGRCGIHGSLAEHGWHGCVAFDCAGAGPHTVHTTYGGDGLTDPRIGATASTTWTAATAWTAAERYAVFRTLLSVFEVGAHVAEARSVTATTGGRAPDPALAAALAQVAARVEQVAKLPAEALTTYDPGLLRALAGPLLRRTAATVRTAYARDRRPSRRAAEITAQAPGADLAGRSLRGAQLRGADLTGAILIGADLRDANLDGACLLGADLRGCSLDGARLEGALFLPSGLRPRPHPLPGPPPRTETGDHVSGHPMSQDSRG